jgi:leader peptidase (prepilin peptidase)/N-methyltransferase
MLGGRCRYCKTRISPRYVVVELLTAVLFVACYVQFGLTLAGLKYCTFGFLLLGLIFTDAETQLLPDKMTLTGLVIGLVFSLLVPVNDLASQWLPGWRMRFSAPQWVRRLSTAPGQSICGHAGWKAWASVTSS